jgi:hypothetical protein
MKSTLYFKVIAKIIPPLLRCSVKSQYLFAKLMFVPRISHFLYFSTIFGDASIVQVENKFQIAKNLSFTHNQATNFLSLYIVYHESFRQTQD